MPKIDVDTLPTFYAVRNADARPALLFIHGAGAQNGLWMDAARRLERAAVFVPDLPGHGQSDGVPSDSIPTYARWIVDFADAVGLDRFVPVGHSMGGGVALQLALDYSERVEGLILVASGARLRVHPDILAQLRDADPVMYTDMLGCDAFDVMPRLGEIHVATLVINGTADDRTPLKYAGFLRDRIAGAEMAVVEGAGHEVMVERPAEVAAAIQAFVDYLPRSA
ncbi:MAG: alpha/beta fold hydrolase [Anaerolineae bacterium]